MSRAMSVTRIKTMCYVAAVITVIPGILHLTMGIGQLSHANQPPPASFRDNANINTNATGPVAQTQISQAPPPQQRGPQGGLFSYTAIFFTVAGITQMFWALPMARRWGTPWYYAGIAGTAVLIAIWAITRMPGNPITGRAAPASFGIYDELFQAAYIAITAAIIIYEKRMKRLDEKTATDSV